MDNDENENLEYKKALDLIQKRLKLKTQCNESLSKS